MNRKSGLIDLSMLQNGDLRQFSSNLNLLRRNVVLISGSDIIERYVVVVSWTKLHVRQDLVRVPGAMVQIQKHHIRGVFVSQENTGWIQVGVDNVLLVQELQQVDDVDDDLDGFVFAEEGTLAAVEIRLIHTLVQNTHFVVVSRPNLFS